MAGDDDLRLPLVLGPVSNGEFLPLAADTLASNRSAARALAEAGELPAPWVPRGPVTRAQLLHWLAHEPGPWIPA